jgi:hypothetical protein
MCTASWINDAEGYHLFFNRDEKLTRKRGVAPRILWRNGIRYVAPEDGDFNGTWIAVNEFGISVCLLNGAMVTGSTQCPAGAKSRGLLIPEVITGETAASICSRMLKLDLSEFSPFTMAVLEPGQAAAVMEWTGAETNFAAFGDRCMPLTSSSFHPHSVCAWRRQGFEKLFRVAGPMSADVLRSWHSSHDPAPGPYSICMHREDARTVSFTTIRVAQREATVQYHPGAPCEMPEASITVLQLAPSDQTSVNASI